MKPIDGMTTDPYGLPMMGGAWLGCLIWAAQNDDMVSQFKADTGLTLDALFSNGINQMIDETTGFQKATVIAFADWVTTKIWGQEGDEPTE